MDLQMAELVNCKPRIQKNQRGLDFLTIIADTKWQVMVVREGLGPRVERLEWEERRLCNEESSWRLLLMRAGCPSILLGKWDGGEREAIQGCIWRLISKIKFAAGRHNQKNGEGLLTAISLWDHFNLLLFLWTGLSMLSGLFYEATGWWCCRLM